MKIENVRILRFSEDPDSKNEVIRNRNAIRNDNLFCVPICFDKDVTKPMGTCSHYKFKKDGLYCQMNIKETYHDGEIELYPILAYQAHEYTIEKKIVIIHSMHIWAVFLSQSENCDSQIKPVSIK